MALRIAPRIPFPSSAPALPPRHNSPVSGRWKFPCGYLQGLMHPRVHRVCNRSNQTAARQNAKCVPHCLQNHRSPQSDEANFCRCSKESVRFWCSTKVDVCRKLCVCFVGSTPRAYICFFCCCCYFVIAYVLFASISLLAKNITVFIFHFSKFTMAWSNALILVWTSWIRPYKSLTWR